MEQKLNSITEVEVAMSSHTYTKPNVGCCFLSHDKKQAIEIIGHPNYTITKDGIVTRKDGRIIKPIYKTGGSGSQYYCIGIQGKKYGLATLVATHFVKKNKNCNKVIFKDRNNMNVTADNLAWVDNETFYVYCGRPNKPLVTYERQVAIELCKDLDLLGYYRTLNETFLEICWDKIDKNLSEKFYKWNEVRSSVFIYFMERVKRFSILKSPQGLMILYAKGVREKECSSLSKGVKRGVFVHIDESLK